MFKIIKKFLTLLTPRQRRHFYLLQALALIMAFVEIVGLAAVFPFISLVGNIEQLRQDTIIAQVYNFSGIKSELQFLFLLGVGVLLVLIISACISMYTIWRLSMFATKVGAEIADRLYSHYLKKNWLFHTSGSTSQLTKNIAVESLRATRGILLPLMRLNSRIAIILFLSLSIFIYDPIVAVVGFTIFAIAYYILYKLVRMRLQRNGKIISKVNGQRFRLMNEAFGGIKDILLLSREYDFIERFNKKGVKLAYSTGTNIALKQLPRYFMELVAFSSMIALILYLIVNHDGNLGIILPIITVYALASLKLLPAFQQIYSSIASIKSNIAAFESIEKDLNETKKVKFTKFNEKKFILTKRILLDNITFSYPNKKPSLNQANMSIMVNSVVGIVGPTGSGKSTLIDILIGLIQPQQGQLIVDDIVINDTNRRKWQNTIGYVAQNIFLSESSIVENVAFGIPKDQIDLDKVKYALKLAHLTDELKNSEKFLNTKVGERGIQLSGGQRQRIGIARALYHQPDIMVFDEATSALDSITERKIMDSIYNLSNKKTIIIISHRLKTVKKCDQIFFINNGQVVDKGVYSKLIQTNEKFMKMAAQA